jgi:eukaryotic-like serine/threonine-protein kinase
MNQDRWNAVNQIFHAALEVDWSQRQAFVLAQSNGDREVQAEIELLLQADGEAGSYLEGAFNLNGSLLIQPPIVVAGDVLCGRFRIVREIAEGGMGRVFEAVDTELAVHVALKVIRPEIACNLEVIARFRQEVRLARSITHPNICRTFDLERESRIVDGQQTEIVFLTMEFLPGETLLSRIKRTGALPLADTLGLARQILAALHSAHGLGITHRDMKPANIMLVPRERLGDVPRAVVTDFGLARLDPLLAGEGLSALTKTGHPIGTLAYMAPEQLEGNAVSPATDIYAFGLILFEMITGGRAFPSDNPLAGIAQRLQGSLSLENLLPRDTPANWRHVLQQCLAVNPSGRPTDANDIIQALETDRLSLTWRLRSSRASFRKVLPWVSVIFTIAMALFYFGLRLHMSRANAGVPAGALVYLTQVKNQTGERPLDTLTELIQAGLSQSVQVNLLDQNRIGDILQTMTKSPDTVIDANTAREIALRAGAVRVIFANVSGSHGKYSLNVDIQQPDNDPARFRDHWVKSFLWQNTVPAESSSTIPSGILTEVRSASNWIRNKVGESANDIARLDTPPDDATTGNWHALEEYSHGETLLAQGRIAEAVTALERATTLDSQFSLAYSRLGDVLISMNRSVEGYQAYNRALSARGQERLTRRELDRIRGIYALDTWDYVTAEAQFRDLTVYYENDYLGWFYRANPLMRMGRTAEAVECLKRSFVLHPRVNTAATIALFALIAGDQATADHWINDLRSKGNLDEALWIQGESDFIANRISVAQQAFKTLSQSRKKGIRSMSYVLLAHLLAETGADEEAITPLSEGIRVAESEGDSASQSQMLMDRAFLRCRTRQYGSCLDDVEASLALNDSPKMVLESSSLLGSYLPDAPVLPALHMRELLRRNQQHSSDNDPGVVFQMAALQTRAELLLAEKHCDAAIKVFHAEDVLDSPAGTREYLGRALNICAARQSDPQRARDMRAQATAAYARGAFRPAFIWYELTFHPPGFYADQLTSWLHLALQEQPLDPRVPQAMHVLHALRGSQALSSRDFQQSPRTFSVGGTTTTLY